MDLVDISDLDEDEKGKMRSQLPDLVIETPNTRVAAALMAAFLRKNGEMYSRAIVGALREMACETARDALGFDAPDDLHAKKRARR